MGLGNVVNIGGPVLCKEESCSYIIYDTQLTTDLGIQTHLLLLVKLAVTSAISWSLYSAMHQVASEEYSEVIPSYGVNLHRKKVSKEQATAN